MSQPDPIDAYLDALVRVLHVDRGRVRRILTEAEDHLRQAAAAEEAAGLAPVEAQRRAIVRFGTPRTVARRFAAEEGRLLPPSLLIQLVLSLGLLAGIGFAAIGVSGLLAAAMGAAFGQAFIAGDPPGVTYTPDRCADFFEYFPHAGDCAAAATAHHFGEVVDYRLAAGVLGLLLLAGWYALRWRYPRAAGVRMLPDGFIPTVGAALFGAAALGLLGMSTMQMVFGVTDGAGTFLSGGIVALAMFALFTVALLRTLSAGATGEPLLDRR